MSLIKMFPELQNKTIWQFINPAFSTIVFKELAFEAQFGPLPCNSFYKMAAIRIVREAQKSFRERVS